MSKANSPVKVLRTALKRLQKGYTKGSWATQNADGGMSVCMEGAIYGYCTQPATQVQKDAISVVHKILSERHPDRSIDKYSGDVVIPMFNDHPDTTEDEVLEIVKLAIIRLETSDSLEEALADEVSEMYE
jgi:hypothetical protein